MRSRTLRQNGSWIFGLWLTVTGWAQAEDGPQRVAGAPVPAIVVLQAGDTPAGGGGAMVDILNSPFTEGAGRLGFNGSLTNGDRFVWYDDGIIFLDSSIVDFNLTGGEGTMGVSNTGGFIYSPSVDGDDSVWSHNGLVQRENVQAPGFPDGTTNTFNSRPTMLPGGQAYWVSGFNESGGTPTEGRVLFTSSTASSDDIAVVLRSDDMVDGLAIDRPSGIGFDYQISDNGEHHIHDLVMDTGSTANDGAIYVDGTLVAREGQPTGDGTNWSNFDVVSINNLGDYLFSGDDDGATTSDEFLAYNGVIAVREGDTLDGVTLTSSASVLGASINNASWAVHAWSSGGNEYLFVTCNAFDFTSSFLVVATGDEIDVDQNGTGDAILTDLGISSVVGPGLWLARDGLVYVNVELDFGGGEIEAIIGLFLPCVTPGIFADDFESGDTSAWSTTVL